MQHGCGQTIRAFKYPEIKKIMPSDIRGLVEDILDWTGTLNNPKLGEPHSIRAKLADAFSPE